MDLFDAGKAALMICGRVAVCSSPGFKHWKKVNGTYQWRCGLCDALYEKCRSCTDEYC